MTKKIVLTTFFIICSNMYANELTLKDIFSHIVDNSTDIKVSESEMNEARLEVKEAYSNLWPDIKVNGSFIKNHEEILFEFEDMEIIMQPDTSKTLSLKVEQPLMQLRVMDLGKAAKKNLLSVENSHKHKIEDVLLQAAEIFSSLIIEEYSLNILQESLKQLQEHYKWAKTSFDNGRIMKSDLLQFSYQIVNMKSRITSAKNSIINLKKSLSVLTGIKENFMIKSDFSFTVTEEEKNLSLSGWIKTASENRKDYLAAIRTSESLNYIVSSTKKEKYPSLSAFFDMNYQFEESGFSDDRSSWVAGISMNWNAYERGSRKIRIQKYENLKNRYQLISEQLLEYIEVSMTKLINNLVTLEAEINAAKERTEYARELYRLRKKEMEVGRAATKDLLDSFVNFTESRQTLKIMEVRHFLSWLSVYRNAGIFLKKFNIAVRAK